MKFKCTSQGIYAYTIPVCHEDKLDLAESHLVDTVKETVKVIPKLNLIEQSRLGVYIMSLGHPPWKTTRDL